MNIGILYIGIGEKYFSLYHDFKESFDKNFLPNHNKHYFLICDNDYGYELHEDETRIIVEDEGWPYPILKRFEYFLKCDTEGMDYLFFINGNAICQHQVNDEDIIPRREHDWLCGCAQKFMMLRNFDYESMGYFKKGLYPTFKGGLLGGRRKEFLEMCEECVKMIAEDFEKYGEPKYYDEVYFNTYALDKKVMKVLPNVFSYFNFKNNLPKIVTRSKEKLFGKEFLKNLKGKDYGNK